MLKPKTVKSCQKLMYPIGFISFSDFKNLKNMKIKKKKIEKSEKIFFSPKKFILLPKYIIYFFRIIFSTQIAKVFFGLIDPIGSISPPATKG